MQFERVDPVGLNPSKCRALGISNRGFEPFGRPRNHRRIRPEAKVEQVRMQHSQKMGRNGCFLGRFSERRIRRRFTLLTSAPRYSPGAPVVAP